jgi:hypothetical protein
MAGQSSSTTSTRQPQQQPQRPEPEPEPEEEEYLTVTRLYGTGLRYINGVASSYGGTYPSPALLGPRGVSEPAFHAALDRVNATLLMYWPCVPCFLCGYLCTPCTLGLSLGGPRVCVAAAERYARCELEALNRSALFREAGMRWELRKTCFRSWIEVQLLVTRREEEGEEGEGEGEEGRT